MKIYVRDYDTTLEKKVWQRVADSGELSEGTLLACKTTERTVILSQVDGSVCAVDSQCPHRGTSLGNGRIEDGNIRCPHHGYEFDLRTGQGVGNDLSLETLRVVASEQPPE